MVGSLIFSEILLFFSLFHFLLSLCKRSQRHLEKLVIILFLIAEDTKRPTLELDTYYAFYDGMKKLQLSLGIRRQIQNILLHLVKNICLSILNWLLYLMRPIQ